MPAKLIAFRKQDQNQAVLDPWSIVHFAAGLASGLAGISAPPMLVVAVGYDIAEQMFERSEVGQKFFATSGPETLPNSVMDLVLMYAGWKLGSKYNDT